jgi:hypothetical protein
MDSLKVEIQNLQDLIDILKKVEIESGVRVTKLGEKVRGATHSLWYAVSEHEAAKIREANFLPVLRSWAAFVQSGAPVNLGHWLAGHFNNFSLDLTQVTRDLQDEYLSSPSKKKGEK